MASKKQMNLLLFLVFMSALRLSSCSAQVQAESSCLGAMVTMAPCLPYIMDEVSALPSECCAQLSSVVNSEVLCLCLCHVINGDLSNLLGVKFDENRTLGLANECMILTPPQILCDIVPIPPLVPSPGESPAPSPSENQHYSDLTTTSSMTKVKAAASACKSRLDKWPLFIIPLIYAFVAHF